MNKINKIRDKIDYIGNNVQAQGCQDDCSHSTDEYAPGEPPSIAIDSCGPAIYICICSSTKLPSDSETWPLW
jgi:hypothetical protein